MSVRIQKQIPFLGAFLCRAALWCMSVLLLTTGTASAQPSEVLNLSVGELRIVDLDFELSNVIIANDEIANVNVLDVKRVAITPLSAGTTRIILQDALQGPGRSLSVNVIESYAQLQAIIDEMLPRQNVKVRNVNGRALVTGSVRTSAEAEKVIEVAQAYSQGDVINALQIKDRRQVMLKINILELSRTGGKELGINLFKNPEGMTGVNGTPYGVVSEVVTLGSGSNAVSIDFLLQALENKGVAKRLANPTLVSGNGTPASFTVGGEVPVVTTTTDGTTTTYREYGVKLQFTPRVLADNVIRLEIAPEVSEVDWTRRVNDNPAFTSRKINTTLELRSGTSFVLAGLLQSNSTRSIRQFPWLGDIPILGALFRSSAYQNNETELVVVATPYLVNESSIKTMNIDPTAKSTAPNDTELFLLGEVEVNDEMIRRFKSGFGVSGPFGHIVPKQ